jgi:dGTPase
MKPLKLCEIIKESQGAYPDDVKVAIDKLISTAQVYILKDLYLISNQQYNSAILKKDLEAPAELTWVTAMTDKLSKPHPADYDWRFTSKTIFDIAHLVNYNNNLYKTIALFGTTTLFPVIKEIAPNISLSLFNKSQLLIDDLSNMGFTDTLYAHDLFLKIPSPTKYKLVIADPPWYNDFYNAFITRASEILEVDGHLFLSVLPILTRPDAEKDRKYIDQCAMENGLVKVESKEAFLNYESPIFERHSLLQKGTDCGDWRTGDLIIYKKARNIEYIKDIHLPVDEPSWEEFIINGIKLKLLKDDDQSNNFSFEYSDKTSILSTVSRRSPIRKRINFWTSENLAFKITKLKVLRYLFRFAKTFNSMEVALTKTRIEKNLTEDEYKLLIDLLTMVNIYK